MSLPFIIEYLLSRPRGQSYLASQSASQTIVQSVPAGVEFTLSLLPVGNDYADLVYESTLHPDMVPNAFYGVMQYTGNQITAGIATTHWLHHILGAFVVVSRTQPGVVTIRNRTNIPQFYSGIVYFVSIKTEDSYREIRDELERVASSKTEKLAQEANQLLTTLTQRLGTPRPPLGGSQ